jgi:hypothetical protein
MKITSALLATVALAQVAEAQTTTNSTNSTVTTIDATQSFKKWMDAGFAENLAPAYDLAKETLIVANVAVDTVAKTPAYKLNFITALAPGGNVGGIGFVVELTSNIVGNWAKGAHYVPTMQIAYLLPTSKSRLLQV